MKFGSAPGAGVLSLCLDTTSSSLPTGAAARSGYADREYVAAGGLLSFGTNVADIYRQIGVYYSV